MLSPSIAQKYFEDLISKGPALFEHLNGIASVPDPTAETGWLDFKAGSIPAGRDAGKPLAEEKLKEIWSQALAGFATTQGGVLIWGLNCRKDGDPPVDRVIGAAYVLHPESFRSRLMELHHLATAPPTIGVDVRAVPDPSDPTRGFVVCFIPESVFKPIRAEYSGHQYFIRAGDDFVVPEVALLRALFVPGSFAELALTVYPDLGRGDLHAPNTSAPEFVIQIKNCGQVTVRGIVVKLAGSDDQWVGLFQTPDGWVRSERGGAFPRSFESPRPLYPGEKMVVFHMRRGIRIPKTSTGNHLFPPNFQQELSFLIYSDNQPGVVAKVQFNEDEMVHRKSKRCDTLPLT